jgi:hypothetical protein
MQIDDLINHRRRALDSQRHQCGIFPLAFTFAKVAGSHLSSLACHFQQPVLVNPPVQTIRKPQRVKSRRRSMCYSMCRELGFTGDCRSRYSQVIRVPGFSSSQPSSFARWASDKGSARTAQI